MSWTATTKKDTGGADFEKPPAGTFPAVLVAMIDLGTQTNTFQGETKEQHRCYWVWELVGKKMKNGRNFTAGIELTFSMHEKAKMRKFIQARLGTALPDNSAYDVTQELGKPCLLRIVHTANPNDSSKAYANVDGPSGLVEGMTVPAPTLTPFVWKLDDFKPGTPISFPDWVPFSYGESIAAIVAESAELKGKATAAPTGGQSQAGSNGTANGPPPRRTDPASPQYSQSPPQDAWYVDHAAAPADKLFQRGELQEWLETNKVKAAEVHICLQGGTASDWKPAAVLGFTDPAF